MKMREFKAGLTFVGSSIVDIGFGQVKIVGVEFDAEIPPSSDAIPMWLFRDRVNIDFEGIVITGEIVAMAADKVPRRTVIQVNFAGRQYLKFEDFVMASMKSSSPPSWEVTIQQEGITEEQQL